MVMFPFASHGKNCNNPHGFPNWRKRWDANPKDPAERPIALTGIMNRIQRKWDKGYRRFMFHRFGGDQAGGSYSNAQWWTFTEEQRFWFMRDDFDPDSGVPMGLKAFIAEKKAEDPNAEFHIYLGFVMLAVDSLIQEEAPFSKTIANYRQCDPAGADPHNLIPDDIMQHRSRTICMSDSDDVGRANQLWLTLGAFIDMGFNGAYYDALGTGNGNGSFCAADLALLPQYLDNGFKMGVEPMPARKEKGKKVPITEALNQAPSVSTWRYLSHRIQARNDGVRPEWDLNGTGAEAAIILRDTDWAEDPSVNGSADDNLLTIDAFYHLIKAGYTPMTYDHVPGINDDAIAMVMGVGQASCPADITFDGNVDTNDILLFIERFLDTPDPVNGQFGPYHADYHDDNMLDLNDINAFINAFLSGCSTT